jgi:hypothetical protein
MVIVLIGIVTIIMLPNLFKTNTKNIIELNSLKEYLVSNYSFSKKISYICIERSFLCYIFIDGVRNENVIENFFVTEPSVYASVDPYRKIEFDRVYVNEFDERGVVFNLTIDSDFKSNEFLLEYEDTIYHYSSIQDKATMYDDIGAYKESVEFKLAEEKYDF